MRMLRLFVQPGILCYEAIKTLFNHEIHIQIDGIAMPRTKLYQL
jgi:hypothetical protein